MPLKSPRRIIARIPSNEGRGPHSDTALFVQMSVMVVTELQSQSGMIVRNATVKPTFDKAFGAFNLLAILWDYKPPLVKSAQVSAESTMNK